MLICLQRKFFLRIVFFHLLNAISFPSECKRESGEVEKTGNSTLVSFSLVWQMLKLTFLDESGKWLKVTLCFIGHYHWFFRDALLGLSVFSFSDLGRGLWCLLSQTKDNYLYVEDHY